MKELANKILSGFGNIRKAWFSFFIFQTVFPIVYLFTGYFLLGDPQLGASAIGQLLGGIPITLLTIYCAYEQRGVKLLLFLMIMQTLGTFFVIGTILYMLIQGMPFNFYQLLMFFFPMNILFVWYSYLYRKENLELKAL